MTKTPYSKSCCKTVKNFYDDYDLLPTELKRLLQEGSYSPTMEDLRSAWDLAPPCTLDQMKSRLHSFKEDVKAEKKRIADAKRDYAKNKKMAQRHHNKYQMIYRKVTTLLSDTNPKHARLVQKVAEEQAAELLARRKENKDVKILGTKLVPVWIPKKEMKKEEKINYLKNEPTTCIVKAWHNAGGKP